MMNRPPRVPSQSTILVFGSLTAVLLLGVLLNGLRSDLRSQLSEGSHRVNEVALNVAQAIRIPLRASANSMTFIAEESNRLQRTAPEESDTLLNGLVAEIRRRQPQILSITFIDAATPVGGSPLASSQNSVWTLCDTRTPPATGTPCFGSVTQTPRGAVLPLATPLGMNRWVVGNIQVDALKRSLVNVPNADDVSFEIVDAHGQSMAQGGYPGFTATTPNNSNEPWWIQKLFRLRTRAPLQATAAIELYPFKVVAGMTYQTALAPWRKQVLTASAFYIFYLAVFVFLLSVMYRATRMQRYYIQSLEAKSLDLQTAQRVGRTAIWTFQSQRFECTDEAEEIFGLPRGRSTASVKEFLALVLSSDRLPLIDHIKTAWESGAPLRLEFRIKKADGSVRRLSAGGQVVVDKAGLKRLTGTVVDVTEHWEVRRQQAESEHRFRSLFEQNPLPFWVFDSSSLRFLEVNAAAVNAYGYTREEFLKMTILDIRDPQDRPKLLAHMMSSPDARIAPENWMHRTKEGKAIDVRIYSADIVFNGRPARLILAEDITSHLAGERELAYRASHDLVTKLPNRSALIEWMDTLIANGTSFEIAYLQLLGMDAISDTFGIHAGTEIFQAVSARIKQLTGGDELLATVTHESFVWVAPSGQLTNEKLEAITQCTTEPLYYKDTQHQITIVIGVASYPRDGSQSDTLLASSALAAHAHIGSDQPIHYFDPSLAKTSKEKLHFAARLRRAVKHHEFEMHFQPITDFPNMRLIGLEALIRWPQADGRFIFPSTFIPLCEESGLIVPLGRWILNQVAKASRELKEAGFDPLPIGVNVSPTELRGGELVANLRAVRQAYSLADNAINIELTESSLIEHKDRAIAVMKQLRSDGVAVALDDFGTGFSSLSYLRDLPIDILKVDQAFIRDVDQDARSATICDAIIALGKSLKVRVIAEGIERASQYHWLDQHGCDGAQGFYLSKPDRLSALLAQWTPTEAKAR
jgi:PAS domain S-box-containing protein/diguanylate cyclase (GGDEF)-like protein